MIIEQAEKERITDTIDRLQDFWRFLIKCKVCDAAGNPRCKQCAVKSDCEIFAEIINTFFGVLVACNNALVQRFDENGKPIKVN